VIFTAALIQLPLRGGTSTGLPNQDFMQIPSTLCESGVWATGINLTIGLQSVGHKPVVVLSRREA
jgi:hypothetical protein